MKNSCPAARVFLFNLPSPAGEGFFTKSLASAGNNILSVLIILLLNARPSADGLGFVIFMNKKSRGAPARHGVKEGTNRILVLHVRSPWFYMKKNIQNPTVASPRKKPRTGSLSAKELPVAPPNPANTRSFAM